MNQMISCLSAAAVAVATAMAATATAPIFSYNIFVLSKCTFYMRESHIIMYLPTAL